MPYGFSGKAVTDYLENIKESLTGAGTIHSENPFRNCQHTAVAPPHLAPRSNQTMPCTPNSGGYTIGTGNQANVVVSQNAYDELSQKISQIDENMSNGLAEVMQQIEEMCQAAYILPKTTPKVQSIEESVKSSMTEFRALGKDAGTKACGVADALLEIR